MKNRLTVATPHGLVTIIKNISGQRFGRWIALSVYGKSKTGLTMWWCKCDCGNERSVLGTSLCNGASTSCGCRQAEITAQRSLKHGQSPRSGWTAEYRAWTEMVRRCTVPTCKSYKHYGGRGIVFCERWHDFGNFFKDMGSKPSSAHSLERIDVNGNYEPSNCKWATRIEQMRNTTRNHTITVNGQQVCLAEAEEITGVKQDTIRARLRRGRSEAEAILAGHL